eukprot:16226-Heterococcus_DN1.PRE.2
MHKQLIHEVPDPDAMQGVTLNAEPVPVGVAMDRSSSGELQVKVTLCNLDRDAYFRESSAAPMFRDRFKSKACQHGILCEPVAGADNDAAILCALQQSLRTETLTQLLADKGSAGEHYIQVRPACALSHDVAHCCCCNQQRYASARDAGVAVHWQSLLVTSTDCSECHILKYMPKNNLLSVSTAHPHGGCTVALIVVRVMLCLPAVRRACSSAMCITVTTACNWLEPQTTSDVFQECGKHACTQQELHGVLKVRLNSLANYCYHQFLFEYLAAVKALRQ